MRFDDKVLFATGAGSGLAEAVARQFAAEGGRVAVADLDAARAEAVAADLPDAIGIGCDVAQEQAVIDAVARTHQHFGRLDCVFNAAGHVVFGSVENYPLAEWNRILTVHATGTFLVCRAAVPLLRAAGRGSIVNVASVAALIATPNNPAYAAAKGAIIAFSRQIALDLAPDCIRVNVIAPGRVRTGMTTPLFLQRGDGDYERGAQIGAERSMQKRIAEPEEIATLTCFLLSGEASFLTGSLHVADGGETAQ